MSHSIMLVVGTRPLAIKVAPVAYALLAQGLLPRIVLTGQHALPQPEEGNRIALDRLSDLMFAATSDNAANLAAEKIGGEVHVTGNTSIDALQETLAALPPRSANQGPARLLVTCHRRENWRAALTPIGLALIDLA